MLKRRFVALLLALCATLLCGCSFLNDWIGSSGSSSDNVKLPFIGPKLISSTETQVVIGVEDKRGSFELIDCMEALKGEEFSFEISGGFILEINGVVNADGCYWMLYTSDTELSNSAWGEITYEDKTLASAALGAESLEVKVGELYIWQYVNTKTE